MDSDAQDAASGGRRTTSGFGPLDEHGCPRVHVPAGTTLYPRECGFVLPDGRYLRLYENGMVEEEPDGRARSGESHMGRPQLVAHRIRTGGNPHSLGPPERAPSYLTDVGVEFVLPPPDVLADGGDEGLIELCHEMVTAVSTLELDIDLKDGDVIAEFAGGEPYAHVIDLSVP